MATVALSEFLPDVLVEVPGVSDPLAERHVREAAIDFCRRTRSYVHRMDPVALVPLESTYDWDIPAKTLVVEPLEVWVDGALLQPRQADELSTLYADWTAETGRPLYYLSDLWDGSARQITLVPKPEAPGSLTARLALMPTRDADEVDAILYSEYGRTIALGAVASLMLMVNKPWSNMQAGAAFRHRFEQECAQVAIRAQRGHVRAPLRTRVVHRVV